MRVGVSLTAIVGGAADLPPLLLLLLPWPSTAGVEAKAETLIAGGSGFLSVVSPGTEIEGMVGAVLFLDTVMLGADT